MKKTPLYDIYSTYDGVKIIEFGGWDLPVNYATGIIEEHTAVRTSAGLFDVSHMGEFIVSGAGSKEYVDWLVTNSLSSIGDGEVIYTPMCYPDGGVVDDLIIYQFSEEHLLLVVNAANIEKDFAWVTEENPRAADGSIPAGVSITNVSAQYCQLAVQGPRAETIMRKLYPEAGDIKFFTFRDGVALAAAEVLISRTGYTGEDGFEIYCDSGDAAAVWNAVLENGAPEGLVPCGLGARDTLRLEAKLPLYGHEITEKISPLEANLSYFVNLEGEDFCGRDALLAQKESGIPRTLRGIIMVDRGVPREGYPVYRVDGDTPIGQVTSGAKSPTLDAFIGLVLMERGSGLKIGDEIEVEIHRKRKKAKLVKTPFYKNTRR